MSGQEPEAPFRFVIDGGRVADDSGRLPALMLDTNVLTFLTDPRHPKPDCDEVVR